MDLIVMTDVTYLSEWLGMVWLSVPSGLTPLMLLCMLLRSSCVCL